MYYNLYEFRQIIQSSNKMYAAQLIAGESEGLLEQIQSLKQLLK